MQTTLGSSYIETIGKASYFVDDRKEQTTPKRRTFPTVPAEGEEMESGGGGEEGGEGEGQKVYENTRKGRNWWEIFTRRTEFPFVFTQKMTELERVSEEFESWRTTAKRRLTKFPTTPTTSAATTLPSDVEGDLHTPAADNNDLRTNFDNVN